MKVKIGVPTEVAFTAHNRSNTTIVGQAVYNVTPFQVAPFFYKIQCFCFTSEKLGPGESPDMPVLFYIDKDYVKDPDASRYKEITLSYTFYLEKDFYRQAAARPATRQGLQDQATVSVRTRISASPTTPRVNRREGGGRGHELPGIWSAGFAFLPGARLPSDQEWFEENWEIYDNEVKAPMGDLVEDVAARLAKARIPIKGDRKSSLFRIHRDVRFARDKSPYKTNAGVAMTRSGGKNDPGVLYFISRPRLFLPASTGLSRPNSPVCAARPDARPRRSRP